MWKKSLEKTPKETPKDLGESLKTLTDVFQKNNGKTVRSVLEWRAIRIIERPGAISESKAS